MTIKEKKERLRRFIKEKGLKATWQRDFVVDTFFKTNIHLTAEELYLKVRKKKPEIGFTTVWRALKLLSQTGLATERVFVDGLTRYEQTTIDGHHDHIICLNCGRIAEFENKKIENLQRLVANELDFEVVSHRMELYGYCKECRNNKT